MSRIGKMKITLPKGATADVRDGRVTVKGKLGTLDMDIHERITVKQENGEILVSRTSDIKKDRALHGMTRALIANMVTGVSDGFSKVLIVTGTGYKAEMKGANLVLNVGYSHPVEFPMPKDVKASIEVDTKKNSIITLTGIDKQRVGQVAAEIRAIRPPDSYKGKGIQYKGEKLRLKEGKSGA